MSGVNTIDKFGRKRKFNENSSSSSCASTFDDITFSRRSEIKQVMEAEIIDKKRLRAVYIENFEGVERTNKRFYFINDIPYIPIVMDMIVRRLTVHRDIRVYVNGREIKEQDRHLLFEGFPLKKGDALQFQKYPLTPKISFTLIAEYNILIDGDKDTSPFIDRGHKFQIETPDYVLF